MDVVATLAIEPAHAPGMEVSPLRAVRVTLDDVASVIRSWGSIGTSSDYSGVEDHAVRAEVYLVAGRFLLVITNVRGNRYAERPDEVSLTCFVSDDRQTWTEARVPVPAAEPLARAQEGGVSGFPDL